MAVVPAGAAVLVLEGEAGIGKTTLWAAAVEAARRRGYEVLTCRPADRESALAYSAMIDLLEREADEVLLALPPAQRRALEQALRRASDRDAAVDGQAVALAFLAALRHLAHGRAMVMALDDVQWIDEASADALPFRSPAHRPRADRGGGDGPSGGRAPACAPAQPRAGRARAAPPRRAALGARDGHPDSPAAARELAQRARSPTPPRIGRAPAVRAGARPRARARPVGGAPRCAAPRSLRPCASWSPNALESCLGT